MFLPRLLYLLPLFPFVLPFPRPNTEPRLGPILDPILDIPSPSASDLLSLDLLDTIILAITLHPQINTSFPGLRDILSDIKSGHTSPEEHIRGFLRAIKNHDSYISAIAALDDDLRRKVERFVEGKSATDVLKKRDGGKMYFHIPPSPAAKEHFTRMEMVGTDNVSRRWLNARQDTSPIIYEDEERIKVMKVYSYAPFENWGLTVHNTPTYTFVPTTILGVENLVKWAKAKGKRVRGAGYRHTWADLYSQDGELLVSMLDLEMATAVPDPSSLLPSVTFPGNQFKSIEVLDGTGDGREKKWVRIGAGVTNEELRRWAVGFQEWTLPMNVIMVEITVGGSTIPMCHGGGIRHPTLADLIRSIEYVDANGKHQAITDPEKLRVASGSLGLLGLVTHVTIEMDRMTYAVMQPKKVHTMLAIPPPAEYVTSGKVPFPLRKIGFTPSELEAARKEWESCALNDYYSEWFWFPYQKEVFINCWNNTVDASGAYDYPTPPDVFLQWIQGWLGGVINDSALFRALPGLWQAMILGTLAHTVQPTYEIRTPLPDALHFRRGVQNMRVRDMELQIPVPADDNGKPDFNVVQRAWWDAIIAAYEDPKAPMRTALEMRMMGGSGVQAVLASQRGNQLGTASIEVLTTMAAVADRTWGPYAQKVADKWMGLKDARGERLRTRPHWSKEWDGMTVDGTPWRDYLKMTSYKDEIVEFKDGLIDIGRMQGWGLEDIRDRFSCSLLDYLFFE